ncbi:MAG TPA: glycine cleavage T C-terminal barrel domain-containing protein [Acidimicrobiia bacterium]|jgi:aminomethyltransferase|nr:glycine cleavage T C-terminal barrel domain-containing protein [Acidimicrobiia bacterium]
MNLTMSPRIRHSPFYDATVRDGVTHFTVYNKMLLPLSFGDLEAEYDMLMNGVALWDVAAERQVQVSGPDAHSLAQYLSARDLTKMKEGQGKYVAMCDHDGRLLNDPVLLKLSGDRYWFSLADHDMLLWCKAVAAEGGFDVEVVEPDVSPLGVQGPLAEDVVADLFGDWVRDVKFFWFRETHLDDIPLVLCRSGWSKQGGFELFLQDGSRGIELYDRVMEAGAPYGIGPGAPNHVERVEGGLLSFGGDNTPDSNPFEAGMGRYVDVDLEPEYIGKAALQRVAAEGPERLFTGLMLEGAAPSAWPLEATVPVTFGGDQVGTMSAIVHSPRLGRTIALAQIRRDLVETGATVEVMSPNGVLHAEVRSLPFI